MERLQSIWATSRGRTSGGIIRSAGCGDLARGSQHRRATEFSIEPAQPQGDAARSDSTLRGGTVCVFRPAHRNLANSKRGDGGASAAVGARKSVDLRGIPPGMFPETKYDSETVQLELGDSVIFLNDGFCLAQNSEGEFFGMESVL
jgi:hypothetical protein